MKLSPAEERAATLACRAGLSDLSRKVLARERLTLEDGLRLYRADLHAVGALANVVRERLHGDLRQMLVKIAATVSNRHYHSDRRRIPTRSQHRLLSLTGRQ